jgi:hypothetical protein
MRSLFAKILGWFVLTLVITLAATILTSALTYNPYTSTRQSALSVLLSLELSEARRAWETGGKAALEDTLSRFRQATHVREMILADADGTDVATGERHPEMIRDAHKWTRFPFSGRGGTAYARFSSDGRYCLFMITPPGSLFFSALQPIHLWVLGLSVLLCYALAYNLTSPLRRLQKAVGGRTSSVAGCVPRTAQPAGAIERGRGTGSLGRIERSAAGSHPEGS